MLFLIPLKTNQPYPGRKSEKLVKVGIITSSAGSTIDAAFNILKSASVEIDFVVVTDRLCESEKIAEKHGYKHKRIPYSSEFDFQASAYLFDDEEVDIVILLHSRLISEVLFKTGKCFNIHPSLLPAFPGMNATQQAFEKKVRFIGVTAHLVDQGVDTGPILSQCLLPLSNDDSIKELNRKSHYLRIYTFLQILEIRFPHSFNSPSAHDESFGLLGNPPLKNSLVKAGFYDYAKDITSLHMFF
jgi:phosphoribosylglycinamide formyltransferase-1